MGAGMLLVEAGPKMYSGYSKVPSEVESVSLQTSSAGIW